MNNTNFLSLALIKCEDQLPATVGNIKPIGHQQVSNWPHSLEFLKQNIDEKFKIVATKANFCHFKRQISSIYPVVRSFIP